MIKALHDILNFDLALGISSPTTASSIDHPSQYPTDTLNPTATHRLYLSPSETSPY
jgi:hypothetical protein